MDQTAPAYQSILGDKSERSRLSNLDLAISLYTFAQSLGLTLFEKTPIKELFNNKNLIKYLSEDNVNLMLIVNRRLIFMCFLIKDNHLVLKTMMVLTNSSCLYFSLSASFINFSLFQFSF